jgi:hypothetical protein
MPFDPCREWLGIDVDDLSDPRRVLGLAPAPAGDPGAVVRAADARLESLGRVSPGPFTKAHAAIVRRVEEARDTLLGETAGDSSPRIAGEANPQADFSALTTGRGGGRRRRRKSGSGGLLLSVIALLGVAVAVLAFLVIRPDTLGGRTGPGGAAVRDPTRPPAPERAPPRPAEPSPIAGTNASAPNSGQLAGAEQRGRRQREAEAQARRDEQARLAAEEARRNERTAMAKEQARRDELARLAEERARTSDDRRLEPQGSAEPVRGNAPLAGAIDEAYRALGREDFAAADRLLADATEQVGDDVEAATRLERWRLLAGHAREFNRFRTRAFAAANEGREYEVDGSRFAIIEINPDMFIYRQDGQNRRVPRGEVDPRLEMAIVEAWFAADGRAANHLFLGAGWFCDDPPDLRRARAEWTIAGEGGEAVEPLLALLDDPVIRRAGR